MTEIGKEASPELGKTAVSLKFEVETETGLEIEIEGFVC